MQDEMVHAIAVVSVVQGYHKHKDVWNASTDGTKIPCEREPGNPKDTLTVVLVEQSPSGNLTVGSLAWPSAQNV